MSWSWRGATVLVVTLAASCGETAPSVHPLEKTEPPTSPSASPSPSAEDPTSTPDGALLTIDDPRVVEASGLARSSRHEGVLYTHNDRGHGPEIFAVDSTGVRAVLTVDVPAIDWEDMAATPDGRLWIGDIGDGEGSRSWVSVSVLEEPAVLATAQLPSTTYRLRYPDGSHDAEALLVHPATNRLYVVTKDQQGGRVYAAPKRLDPDRVNRLTAVAEAPRNVSAGDFAPGGRTLVLRAYGRAFYYRDLGGSPVEQSLPKQRQGESITFTRRGTHVLLGTEGVNSEVLQVPVPNEVRP